MRLVVLGLLVAACAAVGQANAAPGNHGNQTVLGSYKGHEGWQLVVKMNGQKLSLYISLKDKGTSTCYGRCAKRWPPLIDHGQIVVANGSCHGPCYIHQDKLGTARRKGGSLQVTYHGQPLYRYRKDTKTGQVQGQGKNYNWSAVAPNGSFYCKGLAICSY